MNVGIQLISLLSLSTHERFFEQAAHRRRALFMNEFGGAKHYFISLANFELRLEFANRVALTIQKNVDKKLVVRLPMLNQSVDAR